ncbi:hypothetical protein DPMN_160609 [Dreissena polymorpha]|uniref:Uncharacterized protein n=1 Tax=Dreissena polymorpha TaxID=45954 RepID=A0A9D4IQA5_DREPO|nr:hypothetical protein DPMN_160609 [Dreissena polymorpha]
MADAGSCKSESNRSLPFHKSDKVDFKNEIYKSVAESPACDLNSAAEKNKELNEKLEESIKKVMN